MQYQLLFITMLTSLFVSGQSKLSFGINGSADHCYRTYLYTPATPSDGRGIPPDSLGTAKAGFTTGISFQYNLSTRFALLSGVNYSNSGYGRTTIALRPLVPGDPKIPDHYTSRYDYHYLQIPVRLLFSAGKRLRFVSSAGVVTHIFLSESEFAIYEFKDRIEYRTVQGHSDYRPVYLSVAVSAGCEYEFGKFTLRMEPVFTHGITSTIHSSHSKEYLWTLGLQAGLFYRL